MRKLGILCLAAGALAFSATAQQRLDEVHPAAPDGVVEVENISGWVEVTGWDRAEIQITGELGRGVERLDVRTGTRGTVIRVILPRNCRRCEGSELKIKVPRRSSMDVETVSADIEVRDVNGELHLQSVSGDVSVEGQPREVSAQSVSGSIMVSAVAAPVRAKSVSGDIRLDGVMGSVEAESVSGDVVVSGGEIKRGEFGTTSGTIRFSAALSPSARIDAASVSGDVDLIFPGGVNAEFEVSTFSGDIDNDFGPPARRTSEYTSERELIFTSGSGGARVSAKSFSGSVNLRQRR